MGEGLVMIVYRNHEGIVKEYCIAPHKKPPKYDYPWGVDPEKWTPESGEPRPKKTWQFDAEVIANPDNKTRTFCFEKILEWKPL